MGKLRLVIVIEQDNDDIDQLNHVGLGIMEDVESPAGGLKFSSFTITDEHDHLILRTDRDEMITRDADGELESTVYTGGYRFRKENYKCRET